MKSTLTFVGLTTLLCGMAAADAPPPAGSVPLVTILRNVEERGYRGVTEISYDDGEWEVEAMEGTNPVGLRVVPATGAIRSVHADEPHPAVPDRALSLPDLLKSLETAGYATITKVELEPAGWEVDCLKAGSPRELLVDPLTGRVLSDRADD